MIVEPLNAIQRSLYANEVAQPGGVFVRFLLDGGPQLLSEIA